MEIEIISFGKLAEFIKKQSLTINGLSDTDELKKYLENKFVQLTEMKYVLAVNKQIVQTNTPLTGNSTVAIMPPFSGG